MTELHLGNVSTLRNFLRVLDEIRYISRREAIIVAGALNNTDLLKCLGSAEQAAWHIGREGADPAHVNPYFSRRRNRR